MFYSEVFPPMIYVCVYVCVRACMCVFWKAQFQWERWGCASVKPGTPFGFPLCVAGIQPLKLSSSAVPGAFSGSCIASGAAWIQSSIHKGYCGTTGSGLIQCAATRASEWSVTWLYSSIRSWRTYGISVFPDLSGTSVLLKLVSDSDNNNFANIYWML